MGSGCIGSSSSKKNCDQIISSNCVHYQGEPFDLFNVCTGDNVTELMETILTELSELTSGEGIALNDITPNCNFITQTLANKNKDLSTLIQVLFDNQCTLKDLIDNIDQVINQPFSFDLKCLTTPINPSRDQITQALIDLACNLQTDVDQIKEDLENTGDPTNAILAAVQNLIGNYLSANVSACPTSSVIKTGSSSSTQLKMVGFVPIGGIIFYNGSSGNFDQTGLGLASACMENWRVCNGQGGTPDLRGFTLSGATQNVPGQNALLPQATIAGDVDTQTQIGNRKGISKVTLTSVNQIPDHEHNTLENPHSHNVFGNTSQDSPDTGQDGAGTDTWPSTVNTSSVTTGLQVKGVKNRTATQPIENRQPTYYGIFIQRIS